MQLPRDKLRLNGVSHFSSLLSVFEELCKCCQLFFLNITPFSTLVSSKQADAPVLFVPCTTASVEYGGAFLLLFQTQKDQN